jgi:hypothetical protein
MEGHPVSWRRKKGGYTWNDVIREVKDAAILLRSDIDELRESNVENAEVLNFLLKMSGRLDTIFDGCTELWEIGQEEKQSRTSGEDDGDG